MLSLCGEDTEYGGTTSIVLGGWLVPVTVDVFVETVCPLARDNCLTILLKNYKVSKSNIFWNFLQMK